MFKMLKELLTTALLSNNCDKLLGEEITEQFYTEAQGNYFMKTGSKWREAATESYFVCGSCI